MEGFIDLILDNLSSINWQGPAAFVVAVIVVYAIFRKWSLILLILFTVVLSWGVEDLIILNMESKDQVISAPLLIYIVGGIAVLFLTLFSFYKSN